MKRTIKKISTALRDDIADLQTHRAMPTEHLEMIDPFLFLNHHGPQTYPANNKGLPFGPHPHRGFETVTFILEGDIAHQDSGGHESVIRAGGVQWMTAGKGLVHSEVSSSEFKTSGGALEILQLWVNLPASLKMTTPKYLGLQKEDIPIYTDNNLKVQLVSGIWKEHKGPFDSFTDITTMIFDIKAPTKHFFDINQDQNIFFYVIKGSVEVNNSLASARQTVEFNNDGNMLEVIAKEDAIVLLCHGIPFNEPVVSYGPFVMNTREEIQQAISDYQAGKF